jgi:urease accessory protein
LTGHLELIATTDDCGEPILAHQSFAPPVHISKPHRDNGWLVVNMASPSPGLLAGDSLDINVQVRNSARLALTSPSASRIHTMREGERATVSQYYHVQCGAALDVCPEYLIPQAGATYVQKSRVEIADGGMLMWTESFAPGRTARGEVFLFREMRISTDIIWKGLPLVRERYRLAPGHPCVHSLRFRFPQAYHAGIVCICPNPIKVQESMLDLTDTLASDDTWFGFSEPKSGVIVARLVAANSPALRSLLNVVRTRLYGITGFPVPNPRRVTGELAA